MSQPFTNLFSIITALTLLHSAGMANAQPRPLTATPKTLAKDARELINKLQNVKTTKRHKFQLRDDKNAGMDCLKVFQPKPRGPIYGVYHSTSRRVFHLYLAVADPSLTKWRRLTTLDTHASQPTIHITKTGACILAYESDAPNSAWVRIRYYPNLKALTASKFSHQFDIPRTLAPTAEGTPSFESVQIKNNNPTSSIIKLRFHFFKRVYVDQLAEGTLTNFKSWKAAPLNQLNKAFTSLGARGNIGDRDLFTWRGKTYYLQEVQFKRLDWSTWRTFLCDAHGAPIKQLSIKTPNQSTAFSNSTATPIIAPDGTRHLIVTHFIHSKGSGKNEPGQLLYIINEK